MVMSEIIKQIAQKTGASQKLVKEILVEQFGIVKEQLLSEGKVEIYNIGTLKLAKQEARKAKNPSTGAVVDVPAKNKVSVKVSKALKDAVN